MLYEDRLKFWDDPKFFIWDKCDSLRENFVVYIVPVLVWAGTLANFIAIIIALRGNTVGRDSVVLTLIWGIFAFGAYNAFVITRYEKYRIRFNRERKAFEILHIEICHAIRDYRTRKQKGYIVDHKKEIYDVLDNICKQLHEKYVKARYRNDANLTLKIQSGNDIIDIRHGDSSDVRSSHQETISNSYILRIFIEQSINFLYIRDINKPRDRQRSVLGNRLPEIQSRAKLCKYRSFVALPIKTGNIVDDKEKPSSKSALGLMGIDRDKKHGFGNLKEHELHFLGSITDSLSELLYDYNNFVLGA